MPDPFWDQFSPSTSAPARDPFWDQFTPTKKVDVNSVEGNVELARQVSPEIRAEAEAIAYPEQKLSLLQRLGSALGAFNPAEAVGRSMDQGNAMAFPAEYGRTIAGGLAAGVTGKAEYDKGRRNFGDILDRVVPRGADTLANNLPASFPGRDAVLWTAGAAEGIPRFLTSTAADIGLDPTTYVGGRLAKGVGTVLGAGADLALAGGKKFAPRATESAIEAAGKTKDALGRTFQFGYGTSAGVADKAVETQGALAKLKEQVIEENKERFARLTNDQKEELVDRLLRGKRVEFKLAQRAAREEKRAIDKAMEAAEAENTGRAFNLELADNELRGVSREGIGREATSARVLDDSLTARDVRLGTAHDLANRVLEAQKAAASKRLAAEEGARRAGVETAMTGSNAERRALRLGLKNQNVVPQLSPQQFGLVDPVEHYATRAVAEGSRLGGDAVMQKAVKSQIERSRDFAKASGIDDPYAVYFPGLKEESINKFLEGTRGFRVGSEGYKKEFKNLLKDDELIRNPTEAFARREYEMGKDLTVSEAQKDLVQSVGRPKDAFKNDEAARAAGYVRIKEKGNFGETVGFLKENDKKFLDHLVSPEYGAIDELARQLGYDAVTSIFKRSVTSLFPAFHTRNWLSGHVQNFQRLGREALKPENISGGMVIARNMGPKWMQKAGSTVRVRGKDVPVELAMKPFEKRFGGSNYIADIGDATSELPSWFTHVGIKSGETVGGALAGAATGAFLDDDNRLAGALKGAAAGAAIGAGAGRLIPAEGRVMKSAQNVGNFIETAQKGAAYLTALNQGKSVKEALKLAEEAGFDYRRLTKTESGVMRRIMPFYSFTRKNVGLQARTLAENPQRLNQVMQTVGEARQLFGAERAQPGEEEKLPGYIREGLRVKLPDTETGVKQYIASFGTGIEAATQLLDPEGNPVARVMSATNPMIKAVHDLAYGKDSFRQKDLKDVYDAREYKLLEGTPLAGLLRLEKVTRTYKKPDGTTVTRQQYVADPERLYLARSMFTSRGFNTLDQMFGGDLEGAAKWLRLLSGFKAQPVDLEAHEVAEQKRRVRELQNLNARYNKVATIQRAFQPKKKEATR